MDFQLTPCEEKLVVEQAKRSFTIALPAEDDAEETRVPLTPQGVEVLVAQGHKVLIQRGLGLAARFSDESYAAVGAEIVDNEERLFAADLIIKVSPPTVEQTDMMGKGQTLVCLIGRNVRRREAFAPLAVKKVNIVAVDAMLDDDSPEPVLKRSLGEMEGMMAVTTAAHLLEQADGGKGVIIGGITGVPPTEVVIIGADTAALSAARTALALGSNVKIFDTSLARLQKIVLRMQTKVFASVLHPQALTKALRSADVLICARRREPDSAFCVPDEYLSLIKHDAVVVDLDVASGGRTDGSRVATLARPVYRHKELFFHCVPDITALAPHTASIILSDIVSPLVTSLASAGGVEQAARADKPLASAVAMYRGTVTNKVLARRSGLEYFDLRLLLI